MFCSIRHLCDFPMNREKSVGVRAHTYGKIWWHIRAMPTWHLRIPQIKSNECVLFTKIFCCINRLSTGYVKKDNRKEKCTLEPEVNFNLTVAPGTVRIDAAFFNPWLSITKDLFFSWTVALSVSLSNKAATKSAYVLHINLPSVEVAIIVKKTSQIILSLASLAYLNFRATSVGYIKHISCKQFSIKRLTHKLKSKNNVWSSFNP